MYIIDYWDTYPGCDSEHGVVLAYILTADYEPADVRNVWIVPASEYPPL